MTAADTIVDLQVDGKRCPECGKGFGVAAAFCPFDGLPLKESTWDKGRDPLTGTMVDRRYEVVAPLGEGGMGTVYKVRHTTLDRLFAMKVLRRDLAQDPDLAARFVQEARAAAAIHHPSVVAITDFGTLDHGAPYFVMELLVGETLATHLRARGLLAPRVAASVAKRLAEALLVAHEAGIVHRDLKPENVFLVGAKTGKAALDELRICDFGAAKIMGGNKLTRPGVVFGTPYYMSPEQASGQPVDARSDIYSLGVLLYEMVTGAVPFEADTYMGVLTKHMFAAPVKPSARAMGVQLGGLEDVVMRALEKEPSARFASMAEVAAALARTMTERISVPARPQTERMDRGPAQTEPSAADRIQSSVDRHVESEARRQRRMIAMGVVGAAALIGAVALVTTAVEQPKDAAMASAPAVATSVASAVPAAPSSSIAPAVASAPVLPSTSTSTKPRPRPGPTPEAPAVVRTSEPPPAPPQGSADEFRDPWKR